jgi:hypothetical protein
VQKTVSEQSTVVATQEQVSCDLAGEAAILNLKSGIYFGLDPVGARIWELIQEPKTVAQVRDALLEEFDVEPERCEKDVLALLQQMSAHDLIELRNEPTA